MNTFERFGKEAAAVFSGCGIFVILIRTRAELEQALANKDRLEDEYVILILKDSDPFLMRQALKLYPRYLSYMKNDYEDIFYVLKKLKSKIENRIKGDYNDSDD